MKQADVDEAIDIAAFDNTTSKANVVIITYQVLTLLIGRAGYFQRQVLRTVRGMVKTYADKKGITIPIAG